MESWAVSIATDHTGFHLIANHFSFSQHTARCFLKTQLDVTAKTLSLPYVFSATARKSNAQCDIIRHYQNWLSLALCQNPSTHWNGNEEND